MASGMQAIEALRKKHTPKVSCHSHYHSTVGLVVEGCEIGGVVPGGPCDKEFPGGLIQEQDTIMEVDGEAHTPDSLPDALRGKDVVGSSVRLKIRKPSGKTFECTVQRGSIARIEAMGELFLMLAEVASEIQNNNITKERILGVEKQAKIVNDVSTAFLESFKAHVHDLEDALLATEDKMNKDGVLESACKIKLSETEAVLDVLKKKLMKTENEMETLKKEAEAYKHDLETKEAVILDLKKFKSKCDLLNDQLESTKLTQSSLEDARGGLSAALKSAEADLTAYRARMEADEREKVSLNNQLKITQARLNEVLQESAVLQEGLRSATEGRNRHDQTVEALHEENKTLASEAQILREGIKGAKVELEREKALRMDSEKSASKLAEGSQSADAKLREAMQENSVLRAGLASATEEKERVEKQMTQTESLRQQAADKAADFASEAGLLKAKVNDLQQEVDSLQKSLAEVLDEKQTLTSKFSDERATLLKQFQNRNEELLARAKELFDEKKEHADLKEKVSDIEPELHSVRGLLAESTELLERKQVECSTLTTAISQSDAERTALQKKLATAEETGKNVQAMLDSKTVECKDMAKGKSDAEMELKDLKAKTEMQERELQQKLVSVDEELKRLQSANSRLTQSLDAKTLECSALESERISIEQSRMAEMDKKSGKEDLLAEQIKDLEFKLLRSAQMETEAKKFELLSKSLEDEVKSLKTKVQLQAESVADISTSLTEKTQEIAKLMVEKEQMKEENYALREVKHDLVLQTKDLSATKQNLTADNEKHRQEIQVLTDKLEMTTSQLEESKVEMQNVVVKDKLERQDLASKIKELESTTQEYESIKQEHMKQISDLSSRLAEAAKQIDLLKSETSSLSIQSKDLQSAKGGMQSTIEAQTKQVAELSVALQQSKTLLEDTKEKLLDVRGQNKELGIARANLQLEKDKNTKEIAELLSKVDKVTKLLENIKAEKLDQEGQVKELQSSRQSADINLKVMERSLADKEGIIVQLHGVQNDLKKKLTEVQDALANSENTMSKLRSEIKGLVENVKEKTEIIAARDVSITALKLAQSDAEKKLAEMKEKLSVLDKNIQLLNEDSKSKDDLIQRLEVKLREQDSQWTKDVSTVSAQLQEEKTKRVAVDAQVQAAVADNKQLCEDLEQLRKQRVQLSAEKDELKLRLEKSIETGKVLEEKLLEKRDESNAFEAARTKQNEEMAEMSKQLKFYIHEAEVAAGETKKWGEIKQDLEDGLAAERAKSERLARLVENATKANKQLEVEVARLKSDLNSAMNKFSGEATKLQAAIKDQDSAVIVMAEKLRSELAAKQRAEAEGKDSKRQIEMLRKELAKVTAEVSKLSDAASKLEAALKTCQMEKSKEREHVNYYKLESKRAADELALLKVKYDDEVGTRKKMEKSRDEYLSKLNSCAEKLKRESSTAENMTGQVKVLTKSNTVLENDVTRLSAQVEKLDGELKSQKQLRLNADKTAFDLTESQMKMQLEMQKLKDAMAALEMTQAESKQHAASATMEKNSAEQRYKKVEADLKELQSLMAKERALKSQFCTKAEEAATRIEELEASHTAMHGEKKTLNAELNVTRKLVADLERKVQDQDEQWTSDVSLLKEKLLKTKAACTKQHTELADLTQKKTELDAQTDRMTQEIADLKKKNASLQADCSKHLASADTATKAREASSSAKKAADEAAEVAKKDRELAIAKMQEAERQKTQANKEKDLIEQRLSCMQKELEASKQAVRKEQETVKNLENARDAALGKCVQIDRELKTMTEKKTMAEDATAKVKAKLVEEEKSLTKAQNECKRLSESLVTEKETLATLNVKLAEFKSVNAALEQKVKDQDLQWDEDVKRLRQTMTTRETAFAELMVKYETAEACRVDLQSRAHQFNDKLGQINKELLEKTKAYEDLRKKHAVLALDVDKLRQKLESEIEKSATLTSQLKQSREAKKEADAASSKAISELQTKIKILLEKNVTLENSVKTLETVQRDLEGQLQDEIVLKTKLQAELEKEGSELKRLNDELESERGKAIQVQDRIVALEEQVERDQLEAEDEAKKLQDAHKLQQQTESELQRKTQSAISLEDKVKRLETELRDTAAEAAKQACVLSKTKSENMRMETEIEDLMTKNKDLQSRYDELEARVIELDHKLLATQEEVEAEQKVSADKSKEIDFFKAELETAKHELEKVSTQKSMVEDLLSAEKVARDKLTKEFKAVTELSEKAIVEMKGRLASEARRFDDHLSKLVKAIQPVHWEAVKVQMQADRLEKIVIQHEKTLKQKDEELQDKTKHLGLALVQIDEYREQVSNLEADLKVSTSRVQELELQLEDMERLNEELSRQKNLLHQALDADKVTLRGYVRMLQAAGLRFFPDPFPQRCHFKLPDRIWLITIEFTDNRKMLDDLLHQTYIEEDFSKGQPHMTSLPGGLTKNKVDAFAGMLKKSLENHASREAGFDRTALEEVGKSLWLALNPHEDSHAEQQAAVLAKAMLEAVAPDQSFTIDKLPAWLDEMTQVVGDANVEGHKQDLATKSRRDRYTLTADIADFDRNALWIHCCSLSDYIIQTCGRQIANLSTDELRLLQLSHFLRKEQEQSDSSSEEDNINHKEPEEFYTGTEYWNQRDSDSTISRNSLIEKFRMSWDMFQKASAGGFSAPNTPRSHYSSIAASKGAKTARSVISTANSNDGNKTARSTSSWFMGDHLFEA